MKTHLLNVTSGPPINVCVNQLLKISGIDNTPVSFNRCHSLLNRIRFYHKVKQSWCTVEKFDKKNEKHEAMLMTLWNTLKPDEALD